LLISLKKYVLDGNKLANRAFLLKKDFSKNRLSQTPFEKEETFYTKITPCKSVYYKNNKKEYKKIIQKKSTFTTLPVDEKLYKEKLKKAIGKKIHKKIYKISKDSKVVNFKAGFDFDILYTKSDEYKKFQKQIDEEVTFDKRYDLEYLVLFGAKFQRDFNIYKKFKQIKRDSKDFEMKTNINKKMNASTAIRIELFSLYTKLLQNKIDILSENKKGRDILLKYQDTLNRILTIIKKYKELFEPKIVDKILENLEFVYKQTVVRNEIISIRENFSILDKCSKKSKFSVFLEDKDREISQKIEQFVQFLKSRECSIISRQLELLIVEGSKDEEIVYEKSIKKSLKKVIKKSLKKAKKYFKKNIDCEYIDKLTKLLSKFESVKILEDEFIYLFKKKVYSRKKYIDSLTLNLKDYIYTVQFKSSLDKEDTPFEEKEMECFRNEIDKKLSKTLKKVKKSFKKL